MSDAAGGIGVRAILLDIEGTTTPIAFVISVLFPYVRKHLRSYLEEHASSPEHESLVVRLREEHMAAARGGEAVPPWTGEAAFVEWLMDRDRKSTALKELQGKIWERGYRRGEIVGEVFPDVPRALQRWHERRLPVSIFSSGSVLAQRLLFRHSSAGDLSRFLHTYFDTHIGAKVQPDSYRRIAGALALPAQSILFLSDVVRELDAAGEAGMQVRLSIRPGNVAGAERHAYQTIGTFDDDTRV